MFACAQPHHSLGAAIWKGGDRDIFILHRCNVAPSLLDIRFFRALKARTSRMVRPLLAAGIDANGQYIYAQVVESENKDAWVYFLHLKLAMSQILEASLMSDRDELLSGRCTGAECCASLLFMAPKTESPREVW